MKLFCNFFFFNETVFNFFFLGICFSKVLNKISYKKCYFKILKKIKFTLLQSLFSRTGLLFFPSQRNTKRSFLKNFPLSNKNFEKWAYIKKKIEKKFYDYDIFQVYRKKFNIFTISLWEINKKFFSLSPINCKVNSNYGESVLERIQYSEFDFSTNRIELLFFQKNYFFSLIKKYRYDFFLQFPNEHIFSLMAEKILSNFFIILVKIFLTKSKNNFRVKPKISEKSFFFLRKILYFLFQLNYFSLNKNNLGKNYSFIPSNSYKHSSGMFSVHSCKILTICLEYRGKKIQKNSKNGIEKSNRDRQQDLYFFELSPLITVDATYIGNTGRLLNHACNSNCFTRVLRHGSKKFVFIVTRKNVSIIEELYYDYRVNIDDSDSDQIQCLCFDIVCRKELMT